MCHRLAMQCIFFSLLFAYIPILNCISLFFLPHTTISYIHALCVFLTNIAFVRIRNGYAWFHSHFFTHSQYNILVLFAHEIFDRNIYRMKKKKKYVTYLECRRILLFSREKKIENFLISCNPEIYFIYISGIFNYNLSKLFK